VIKVRAGTGRVERVSGPDGCHGREGTAHWPGPPGT